MCVCGCAGLIGEMFMWHWEFVPGRALAGPSLGYALEFNFAAGIVGWHCAGGVGDGAQ